MPKVLDPNHLALMTATRDAVEVLREVNASLNAILDSAGDPVDILYHTRHAQDDIVRLTDRLRLTLKGRIG